MPLVDQDAFDIVHWLDDNTAFATAIDLFQVGIPVGGSSGAAMAAARYEARIAPEKSVIVICPENAVVTRNFLLREMAAREQCRPQLGSKGADCCEDAKTVGPLNAWC